MYWLTNYNIEVYLHAKVFFHIQHVQLHKYVYNTSKKCPPYCTNQHISASKYYEKKV